MARTAGAILGILLLSPPARAEIRDVSTVAELNAAVAGARPGDEIVLRPGTYNLTNVVWLHTPNVTLRGATGDRDDVSLVGGGMNTRGVDEGISVGADDITIRDLTVRDFYYNGIHIRAESDADRTRVSNVKTVDIGERHIKGSRNPDTLETCDDGVIENVHMLQTRPRTGHPDTDPNYIGGIDMMALRNYAIRDCTAEGIVGSQQGGNAAIFLWQGIQGVVVERNVIIGCTKGIALGNPYLPLEVPRITGDWHAADCIIRNNFILRGPWTTGNNIGIELANTRDIRVLHNTVYSENASYFRTISISNSDTARALTTNVQLRNNIVRGNLFDFAGGTGWTSTGDLFDGDGSVVTPDWFANPSRADFHLTAQATVAVDRAAPLADVTEDVDGHPRPAGAAPDLGADEKDSAPGGGGAGGGGCGGGGGGGCGLLGLDALAALALLSGARRGRR